MSPELEGDLDVDYGRSASTLTSDASAGRQRNS